MVRMRAEQFEQLDGWIARQGDPRPTRPEAIRRLIEAGLQMAGKPLESGSKRTQAQGKRLPLGTMGRDT